MKISLIAAISENNVIGYENRLPWHLPEDLINFRRLTMGKPILMGRKTFESLPRVLDGRTHLVITNNRGIEAKNVYIFPSISEAIEKFKRADEIMVIGGASLYDQMIEQSSAMYITKIHENFPGDVFFPDYDLSKWFERSKMDSQQSSAPHLKYSFRVYTRRA